MVRTYTLKIAHVGTETPKLIHSIDLRACLYWSLSQARHTAVGAPRCEQCLLMPVNPARPPLTGLTVPPPPPIQPSTGGSCIEGQHSETGYCERAFVCLNMTVRQRKQDSFPPTMSILGAEVIRGKPLPRSVWSRD